MPGGLPQRGLRLLDVLSQLSLACPDLAGLGLQGLGIPAGRVDGGLGVAVAHPLGRHRERRGHPLPQGRQRIPSLLAAVEVLRRLLQLLLRCLLRIQGRPGLSLCTFFGLGCCGLVGEVGS